MISDTLCEACEDIQQYLHDMPNTYADIRSEVEAVYTAMRALQAKLDWPYSMAEMPVRTDGVDLRHDCLCAYWRCRAMCDCGLLHRTEEE
jgi:hypothetical protein